MSMHICRTPDSPMMILFCDLDHAASEKVETCYQRHGTRTLEWTRRDERRRSILTCRLARLTKGAPYFLIPLSHVHRSGSHNKQLTRASKLTPARNTQKAKDLRALSCSEIYSERDENENETRRERRHDAGVSFLFYIYKERH